MSRKVERDALRVQVLLADLEARQREIDQRTTIDAQSFAVLFGVTATVVAALLTTEIWQLRLEADVRQWLPSAFLVLSIISLWFPLNNLYIWFEVRVAARYQTHRTITALREVVPQQGAFPVMTWEDFRDSEVTTFRWRSLPFYISLVFRAALLYVPWAVAIGYAVFALGLFRSGDTLALEWTLLVIACVFFVFPAVTYSVLNLRSNRIPVR